MNRSSFSFNKAMKNWKNNKYGINENESAISEPASGQNIHAMDGLLNECSITFKMPGSSRQTSFNDSFVVHRLIKMYEKVGCQTEGGVWVR